MKKLFTAIITLIVLVSCSLDKNPPLTYLEPVSVISATMPESFTYGETYQIEFTYLRPSDCHVFHDIYSVRTDNVITIAVINSVTDNGNCQTINAITNNSFEFLASDTGSYTFKFWQGETDDGEDIYLTMEVPIEE
ncbi:hypothetical protein [Olleya aquimaris]|uniref:Uncharacterized protein n=1 Tax=Olleya aquimaris TaxID=639310 RepID=A0A327RN79_9FLAO|nr:hypothetical protein [Olleya aquimaris]RAJ17951.1 hypothetical protein LY08_00221 [Olleya aquimaris]